MRAAHNLTGLFLTVCSPERDKRYTKESFDCPQWANGLVNCFGVLTKLGHGHLLCHNADFKTNRTLPAKLNLGEGPQGVNGPVTFFGVVLKLERIILPSFCQIERWAFNTAIAALVLF